MLCEGLGRNDELRVGRRWAIPLVAQLLEPPNDTRLIAEPVSVRVRVAPIEHAKRNDSASREINNSAKYVQQSHCQLLRHPFIICHLLPVPNKCTGPL